MVLEFSVQFTYFFKLKKKNFLFLVMCILVCLCTCMLVSLEATEHRWMELETAKELPNMGAGN